MAELDPLFDSSSVDRDASRYRVKVADPHTEREYLVTAASRDDAWRYVSTHRDELTPDTERTTGGVYWAAPDAPH